MGNYQKIKPKVHSETGEKYVDYCECERCNYACDHSLGFRQGDKCPSCSQGVMTTKVRSLKTHPELENKYVYIIQMEVEN